jgi:lysozyme family protein
MTIQQQISAVIAREGGYSNRSADRGGPTNYGITEATARQNGYVGDMRNLPLAVAQGIYLKVYWVAPHLDAIDPIAPRVAAKLFDIGVNCGTGTALKLLRRALNALAGAGLVLDGSPFTPGGPTDKALRAYLAQRPGNDDELVLLELIACLQGERYVEIVEADATQRANLFGWIRARVSFGLDDLAVPAHLATS